MNRQAIFHASDSKYCFATDDKTITLRLQVAKDEALQSVSVIYGNKYDFNKVQKRAQMQKKFSDGDYDYYIANLTLEDVRFVYVFELKENDKIWYFSEDGVTETYNFVLAYYNSFQLPYINAVDVHRPVEWMQSAVFYQIFVDRFYQGDIEKDTSYINLKWGDIPNPKSFAGGDLRGIIKKLDYISKLGVSVLYLTPIFTSVSNHKYDISDYFQVDKHFGTNGDLKELIEKAHQRGIKVVLDAVFNHCSKLLPQFQDVVTFGKASKYYDWFLIRGEKPIEEECNYECFASCAYMPKFNTSNKDAQDFLIGVATHWIREYDIDGWRLDVSDEVSHHFWRRLRQRVKAEKSDCVIIGENWHDANPFLRGDQYDSIMNYAFTKACLDFFAKKVLDADAFIKKLSQLLMRNTDQVNSMMLNILDSHDTHRFYTEAGCSLEAFICALAVLFLFVGCPGIYYGTELAMEGGYDPDCRRTLDWTKAEKETELKEIIRKLAALKKREELKKGDVKLYSKEGLFVLERFVGNKTLILYVNFTDQDCEITTIKKPILSYRFCKNKLKKQGFLIVE